MKKELDFINIQGAYGGDQHWLTSRRKVGGGCSTVCACEVSICLANRFPHLSGLFRPDSMSLRKGEFIRFADEMFEYIYPHEHGLDTLPLFVDSYEDFARSRNVSVRYETMPGEASCENARDFIISAVDAGYPLAYLLLRHADPQFSEYGWHWFTVTGYEESQSGFDIIIATWGTRRVLPLQPLWNTGHERKGGMVKIF